MNTNNTSAPSASSNNKVMDRFGRFFQSVVRVGASGVIVGSLVSCAVGPVQSPHAGTLPGPAVVHRAGGRWPPAARDPARQEPLDAGALERAAGLGTRQPV